VEQTNRKFAAENEAFKNACTKAEETMELKEGSLINPRQASKFRRGMGIAYKMMVGIR